MTTHTKLNIDYKVFSGPQGCVTVRIGTRPEILLWNRDGQWLRHGCAMDFAPYIHNNDALVARLIGWEDTIIYHGVPYWITVDPVMDGYQSPYDDDDCGYRYYGRCVDADGNEYEVRWEPTQGWIDACRWYELVSGVSDIADFTEEMEVIAARAGETVEDYVPMDVGDESNACDWDHPESVVPV